jgi:hypothetical protein
MSIDAKHCRTLEELFAHPISMNIDFWKVVNLFKDLGAEVDETKKDHLKVKLGGQEMSFPIPRKKNIGNKHEVVAIRDFLERAGVTPESEG